MLGDAAIFHFQSIQISAECPSQVLKCILCVYPTDIRVK